MKHSKASKEQPVSVNVERMTTARNMPKHIIPRGLSGEEIRAHILAAAKRAEAGLEQHEG